MKVAVCLFGHLRTYKKCYKSIIKNIIHPNNADVFMHTWDTLESETATWHNKKTKNRPISPQEQHTIQRIYTTQGFVCEKQIQPKTTPVPDDCPNLNAGGFIAGKNICKSMRTSVQLAQAHNTYDIIILVRNDLYIKNKLIVDITKKHLLMFCGRHETGDKNHYLGYHCIDLLLYTSPAMLNKFLSYFPEDKNDIQHLTNGPSSWYIYMDKVINSVPVPNTDFNYIHDYYIKRKPIGLYQQIRQKYRELKGRV